MSTSDKKPSKGFVAQMSNPLSDPRVMAIVEEARKEYQQILNAKEAP